MYLYKSATTGKEIKAHSYSASSDWKCPRKYFLKRIQGWQSREERPALEFGKSVESALVYYHKQGLQPGSGVSEFEKIWEKFRETELGWTEKSGNWADHLKMGKEMLALYEAVLPTLPIDNVQFQVEFKKQVAEGTEYQGLQYGGIADIISTVPANHPELPPNGQTEGFRQLVIDVKTSSASYFVDPRLASLDPQLRDYAWLSGLDTVAFLVFVKNHSSLSAGDWVTVLRGSKAGKKYQVVDIGEEKLILLNKTDYEDYNTRKAKIKGKGSSEAKEALLAEYFYKGISVPVEDVTKQKIQFLPAVISEEDRAEAEEVARQETIDIAAHSQANFFPKIPGVRFPSNQCTMCECIGLCIKDEKMVKEKLIQIQGVF